MDLDGARGDRARGGGAYASELRAARAAGVGRGGGRGRDGDGAAGRVGAVGAMMRERGVRDGQVGGGAGDGDAAALRDRVEALKVRIDARYRASRRDGDAAESLFEPVSGASARMKELETERALARLITRANLEARAQRRRSGRLNDSATTVLTEEEYDEIFSERSTEGSFHGYSTGKHARRSSFEDERIKFDSALPSVVDDDYCAEIGGRRYPTPGRTRDWLETTTPSSPERNSRRDSDRDLETTSTLMKSPRRNGSFKMLSPEVAKTMTADEALRPRVRRALVSQAATTSPDTRGSPKSPSERSVSRTSSTLSIASLCTSDRPSSAFSPVARRQEKKSTATTTLTTTAIQDDASEQANVSIAARARTTRTI